MMTPDQRRHYELYGPWTGDHHHPPPSNFWFYYLATLAIVIGLALGAWLV